MSLSVVGRHKTNLRYKLKNLPQDDMKMFAKSYRIRAMDHHNGVL